MLNAYEHSHDSELNKEFSVALLFNPWHPKISMYFLLTVLNTFLEVLTRRNYGKIAAQPYTSLCMHVLLVIHWIIKPHLWMHNEVWGCAEILPKWLNNQEPLIPALIMAILFLHSRDRNISFRGDYCKEKLDATHSKGRRVDMGSQMWRSSFRYLVSDSDPTAPLSIT